MLKTIHQQGFTLIEFVIVIVITGIIAVMSSQLLFQSVKGYFTAVDTMDANWQGQIAMQTMARNIKTIRSPQDITMAASNRLTFVNINNNTFSFGLTGNSIVQTKNGNNQILADGISSMTFSYFDKTGASTTTPANISYIKLTINVTQKNVNFTLSSALFPINF
jgi:prepilin-type N-terminal cleavage/methylation domain-containing protein